MKKTILTVAFISATMCSFSQTKNDTLSIKQLPRLEESPTLKTRSAGDELQLASNHFYVGVGGVAIGTGLIYSHQYVKNFDEGFAYFGGIVALVGTAFIVESQIHNRRAGIILNRNGIGLKLSLNK